MVKENETNETTKVTHFANVHGIKLNYENGFIYSNSTTLLLILGKFNGLDLIINSNHWISLIIDD
ncbi:hypothetical protein Lalb_Chr03g0037671 [Lupinus albus]|uniref:Uncharacterized protein n=1 Tax=Lupinus albus TaxID=3870 RepID=A0A6A4QVK3_LUPAL|nr:hypothetical protein Lalb_Chr03g0037671 [Lupinus albus]